MKKIYDHIEIEQYVLGTMTTATRAAFEAELERNSVLADEVEFYTEVIIGISYKGLLQGVEQSIDFDKLLNETAHSESLVASASEGRLKALVVRWKPSFAAAASIALLLFASVWLFVNDPLDNNQNLAQTNVDAITFSSDYGLRNILETTENNNNTETPSTIEALEQIATDAPNYTESRLLLAQRYFEQNQYVQAAQNAQLVIDQTIITVRRQKAEWLLLNTWLAEDKLDANFQTLLQTIAKNQDHQFHQAANQLVLKLRNGK